MMPLGSLGRHWYHLLFWKLRMFTAVITGEKLLQGAFCEASERFYDEGFASFMALSFMELSALGWASSLP